MAKLQITDDQEVIVTAVDGYLDDAFASGTEDQSANEILAELEKYIDLPTETREQVRSIFLALIASMIKAANIRRSLPNGISTTVALAKLTPEGANGSATFVDGFLTAYSAPT